MRSQEWQCWPCGRQSRRVKEQREALRGAGWHVSWSGCGWDKKRGNKEEERLQQLDYQTAAGTRAAGPAARQSNSGSKQQAPAVVCLPPRNGWPAAPRHTNAQTYALSKERCVWSSRYACRQSLVDLLRLAAQVGHQDWLRLAGAAGQQGGVLVEAKVVHGGGRLRSTIVETGWEHTSGLAQHNSGDRMETQPPEQVVHNGRGLRSNIVEAQNIVETEQCAS